MSILRSTVLGWLAASLTSGAHALEIVRIDEYEMYGVKLKVADQLCQKTAFSRLVEDVNGLTKVEIEGPSFWETEIGDALVLTYRNMVFRSEFGDTNGQLMCLMPRSGRVEVETAFFFEGGGLAGFQPLIIGETDPSNSRRQMVTFYERSPNN